MVEGHGRSGHGTSSASAGGLAGSCGQLWLGGVGGWEERRGRLDLSCREYRSSAGGRGGCCRRGWCVGTAERGMDQYCSALP